MSITNKCAKRVFRTLPLTLSAAALSLVGCQASEMFCISSTGRYAVEYELQSGAGDCAMLSGDTVVMTNYTPVEDGTVQWDRGEVAIRSGYMEDLLFGAENRGSGELNPNENEVYALGGFSTAKPDNDRFCRIPTLSEARISLPELAPVPVVDDPDTPEDESENSQDAQPATNVGHTWSDVAFYVTPDAGGSQFTADLAIRRDDCSARYRARGVFPVQTCISDDDCTGDDSSINPDYTTHCNTDIGSCVLDTDPPSLR